MSGSAVLGVTAVNDWLVTFSVTALATLAVGSVFRRAARRAAATNGSATPDDAAEPPKRRGVRRRAGMTIALGPLFGLGCAAVLSDLDALVVVLALGAAALAGFGARIETATSPERATVGGVVVAAVAAVAAGASFGPSGVDVLDVGIAFAVIVLVTLVVDGQGNVDGLVAGLGTLGALALFGIAAFAGQDGLAAVLAGFVASCFGFLAFNTRPASLFVGRGGRLAIGFVLATAALSVRPVSGTARELLTPLIVLGMLLLDGTIVVGSRLRRRHSLSERRSDHLIHRFVTIGWSRSEAVATLLIAQGLLSFVALFTARAIFSVWFGAGAAAVILIVLTVEGLRARLEREHPAGFDSKLVAVVGVIVVASIVATIPAALAAKDVTDLMENGRSAASRGLSSARDGDTITALGDFHEATLTFQRAVEKLDSPLVSGALAVPGVASNVRAARTLAKVGADLAAAGESLAEAARPDELEVVDGRLPLDVVQQITPKLEGGSAALTAALQRINSVRDLPYLASQVREALDKIHPQLVQAEREARHAADAAKLAPGIFGGHGTRRYLLAVQNNAEARAAGGFIGSYAVITAKDGKLTVGPIQRTNTWNQATRALDDVSIDAPRDYLARYEQFRPDTTLQNVNMSPDFPSVAQALMSLAPQAGVGEVDGVMAVDPEGLAALLELTGPVTVDGWPTPIDAGNVVNATLRDAYQVFARTPERVDFLGDVAKAAVDKATSTSLGKPAKIAQVLGRAAHGGHLILGFRDPAEQRLAEELGVAGQMRPVNSDAIAVTTSNAAGNKLDYYLQRSVDYRVMVSPNDDASKALTNADLTVELDNTAPNSGLPEGVIGPFDSRFQAGQARNFLSLYSPLRFDAAAVDGRNTDIAPGRERGRNVYSLFVNTQSKQTSTITAKLAGIVDLHDGWYRLDVGHQATLNADKLHVAIDVPEGWKIDRAPGMKMVFDRRATVNLAPEKPVTLRVHIVQALDTWDIWRRLEAGR